MASYMKFDQDEDQKGYRWETEYEKTWEKIKETENGLIEPVIEEIQLKYKKNRLINTKNLRLGIMRNFFIILDMSTSMNNRDLKPNRFIVSIKLLEMFIKEFLDQNPISQIGIIITRNKRGERISDLSGISKIHLQALKKLLNVGCIGEASIQNSLEIALNTLKHMPTHTSKEILLLMGSLTTCDPRDINKTIDSLIANNIRCSVIGFSAEVRIHSFLAKQTKGVYNVILDESHYKELILNNLHPPPSTLKTESSLIKMGFPDQSNSNIGKPSMCVCHPGDDNNFSLLGYFCPNCSAKYCMLPVECQICGLTLVSSTHLSKSYHHLFPIDFFIESSLKEEIHCFACMKKVKDSSQCEKCEELFCIDCDLFIHEIMHFCPGCNSNFKLINNFNSI